MSDFEIAFTPAIFETWADPRPEGVLIRTTNHPWPTLFFTPAGFDHF
ncbi:MAG: hypothetical protein JWP63_2654 [Candidatus Solibacter sp.]|jgi:hypothetical protein|nr:hypothetical protein [Candidatus Solibacter sp.]